MISTDLSTSKDSALRQTMLKPVVVQVVFDKPLAQGFDYLWDVEKIGKLPEIGNLVEVPLEDQRVLVLL